MKIAVVSDIHGNLPALQAVLEDIERQRVDQVVNLGDILSGPLMPAQTADFLMARPHWITIAGNHERQLLKVRAKPAAEIDPATSDGFAALEVGDAHAQWLGKLQPTHRLADDLLLVHGTPGSDLVYWMETVVPGFGEHGSLGMRPATTEELAERLGGATASLVLCGHTHVPRIMRSGTTLIANPGSVGVQAYEDVHPHRHRTENGSPEARYALVERQPGGWQVRLCSVPYDWMAMSRLAERNGRPDWAYALATGRMPPLETKIPA